MFKVGDKVVCPRRGCGIVEMIENRTFLDQVQEYFIIKILNANMTVMIPTCNEATSNFRLISDLDTTKNALAILSEKFSESAEIIPAKQRFKDNMLKITSGSLADYAEVIRDLSYLQKVKPLNSGEKGMLVNARKFLINEISLIKDIPESQVISLVDQLLP